MTFVDAILEEISIRPMTSTELAEVLGATKDMTKITLCKLAKRGAVTREKMKRTNAGIIRGPVSVYYYSPAQRGEEVSRVVHSDEVTGSIPVAATTI